MAKLVNKQFNSPIGLYSEQNIREVIERETQILSNGAVGVNFESQSNLKKPGHLQNSAVLRMLEEEENRRQTGHAIVGGKVVTWPPPPDDQQVYQQNQDGSYAISNGNIQNQPPSTLPVVVNPSPVGFRPTTPTKQWAPVQSPTKINQGPPSFQQTQQSPYQQQQQQFYQPQQQQQSPQPYQQQNPYHYQQQPQYPPPPQQYQQSQIPGQNVAPMAKTVHQPSPIRQVEPPPATITLRQQAPISQTPPPVVTSQPATATLKGGKHLRGDLKWPPENVRRQVEEENRQRIELARGPAFRPTLVRKDYGPFFAQHALNSSYPGYKAPPGTQFYEHHRRS